MSFGRHILVGVALTFLTACTATVEQSKFLGPIRIDAVSVDTSTMTVEGRELPVSRATAAAVLENSISSALTPESDPNGTPVNVNVVVTQVRLAPPLERAVAGTSTATGTVVITRSETGEQLSPPTSVMASSTNLRAPGIVGLATTVTPTEDYGGTVRGFAEAIRQTIFGSET